MAHPHPSRSTEGQSDTAEKEKGGTIVDKATSWHIMELTDDREAIDTPRDQSKVVRVSYGSWAPELAGGGGSKSGSYVAYVRLCSNGTSVIMKEIRMVHYCWLQYMVQLGCGLQEWYVIQYGNWAP